MFSHVRAACHMFKIPLRLDFSDILQKRSRKYKVLHNFRYSPMGGSCE
jgi:hypothetical protein